MIGLLSTFGVGTKSELTSSYATLLDSLNEAVLVVNAESDILFANRSWQHLAGVSGEEGVSHLLDYMHPADRSVWQQLSRQVNLMERPAPLWLRIMGTDRELCWCELRVQSLKFGTAWPASLTLCDITSQVRHDQIRSANYRSLSQLVNGLPAMVYRARNNRNWTMEYVSNGCHELTGYSAEALLNHPHISYGKMIHAQDANRVWEQVQDGLREDRSFELNYRIQCADGSLRHVNEKAHGVYSQSGSILGVEGVIIALEHV